MITDDAVYESICNQFCYIANQYKAYCYIVSYTSRRELAIEKYLRKKFELLWGFIKTKVTNKGMGAILNGIEKQSDDTDNEIYVKSLSMIFYFFEHYGLMIDITYCHDIASMFVDAIRIVLLNNSTTHGTPSFSQKA